MGNCLRLQSSTRYASDDGDEDDWDFTAAKEEEGSFGASNKATTEVKIKITKKQLEELLAKVDVKDLRVEQVLSQLMSHSGGGGGCQALQRPWRPALQSIPEVN